MKGRFPNLRKAMKSSRDKIKDLADALCMSRSACENRLRGKTMWNLDDIRRVCKRYHLTFEYLFED